VLVSACLLGCRCRHDGQDAFRLGIAAATAGWQVIPICPEQLGGLPTPREAASFVIEGEGDPAEAVAEGRGRLLTISGEDVTEAYLEGARQTIEIAREHGATRAILKSKSPSCGASQVYLGQQLVPGSGITARALKLAGLEIEEL